MGPGHHFSHGQAGQLPEYHDHLLSVKLRQTDPRRMAGFEAIRILARDMLEVEEPRDESALGHFYRAGMIRRIIPTASLRSGALIRGMGLLSVEPRDEARTWPGTASAATSLVELEPTTRMEEVMRELARDPEVAGVSRVPVRYLATDPLAGAVLPLAAPPAGDMLWNLKKIRWPEARAMGLTSATDIRVAVLDSGVDTGHPDLPAIAYTYAYPGGIGTSDRDIIGHGTHVVGVIGAVVNNEIGINGICEACKLSAYKIVSDNTTLIPSPPSFVYTVDPLLYRAALAACLDDGVDVLNLSMGGYAPPDHVELALLTDLMENGTTVVAAMGNNNTSGKMYPAGVNGVVAVGATRIDDRRAEFSNHATHMALCAPGVGIWSTLPTYEGQTAFYATKEGDRYVKGERVARETLYDAWQGTSMAVPHVAAAAALVLARHGRLKPAEVRARLIAATDKVPGMNGMDFVITYGHGRLNLTKI